MDKVTFRRAKVLENREVAPGIFLLRVEGDHSARPGQFYMLRAWELDPPLSRPLSVFDLDPSGVSFLYKVRGRGTRLLSRLSPGDELAALGPLGNGWKGVEGRVALVGGGLGIAPLLLSAKSVPEADVYLGFPGKPYLVEEFRKVAEKVYVTSETGEGGERGLVSDLFSPEGYDACFACGPLGMLKEVAKKCREAGVPLYVSLEERMACGLGACLGCTVPTKGGPRRVCKDGPVFLAEEPCWDG
ncbi:MAG: Dihydroorotate dehydrogenase B (NAD(+)), electron transfer subunit [Acetothermia bacterium 64_32]|nr:MAG: Dihydroorotate dehydrogenase B (NAD(+)), electron transfer subunit [Acetothermia bacterium 64_32]HAF69843.1 dihydroorotate dehydrogenase electron transfer subunit [Candidatus Acetothermia bacterium]